MAKINSLRDYLAVLESAGQLRRVSGPVSRVHELANVAATLARRGGSSVLFEKPSGSEWQIFANAVVNQDQAALALGCAVSEVSDRMGYALDQKNGIAPRPNCPARWQQNVIQGDRKSVV